MSGRSQARMSANRKVSVALVGLGKMGVSHLAIANASQRLEVAAVCDSFTLLGQMVEKHCNWPTCRTIRSC